MPLTSFRMLILASYFDQGGVISSYDKQRAQMELGLHKLVSNVFELYETIFLSEGSDLKL